MAKKVSYVEWLKDSESVDAEMIEAQADIQEQEVVSAIAKQKAAVRQLELDLEKSSYSYPIDLEGSYAKTNKLQLEQRKLDYLKTLLAEKFPKK